MSLQTSGLYVSVNGHPADTEFFGYLIDEKKLLIIGFHMTVVNNDYIQKREKSNGT